MTQQQENAREIKQSILNRVRNGDSSDLDIDGFIPCDYML